MRRFLRLNRFLAVPLAVALFALAGPTGLAQARIIGTGEALTASAGPTVADQRADVIRFLSRADVQSQLKTWGVDPDLTIEMTPEQMKAWSQNLGHEDVMTTFRSYGRPATARSRRLSAPP